jgi:hypothetical protein
MSFLLSSISFKCTDAAAGSASGVEDKNRKK